MDVFFDNVRRFAESSSRFRSLDALSGHINPKNKKYLAHAKSRGQDISLSKACAVADALGVSLGDLVRAGPLMQDFPTSDQVLVAHDTAKGKISKIGSILDFTDLYHPPKEGEKTVQIFRMGTNSLAARTLQQYGPEVVQEALNSSGNTKLDEKLKASYDAALAGIPIYGIEELNEKISVHPYRIAMKYVRLLLRVQDDDGRLYVMNYSLKI